MPTQNSKGIPNIINVIMTCALVKRTIIEQIILEKNYLGILNIRKEEPSVTKITGKILLSNIREAIETLKQISQAEGALNQ